MTAKQFRAKAERLNTAYMNHSKLHDHYNSYCNYNASRAKKAEVSMKKYNDKLVSLVRSVSEEIYNESGVAATLCADWNDWQ